MSAALDQLRAELLDIETDLAFVGLAVRLRPRLGRVMNWETPGEATELARRFVKTRDVRIEGILGPLLVRLLAAFERFIRGLMEETIAEHAAATLRYDQLAAHLKNRNTVLTGRLLASIESPREHLSVQVDSLVANLATCKAGNSKYQLNGQAFAAAVIGVAPGALEKVLANVGVRDWWDQVGEHNDLAGLLGTKGARATGKRARERLEELWRWRNHLAHGGYQDVALSESQLEECLGFIRAFTERLDAVVLGTVKPSV